MNILLLLSSRAWTFTIRQNLARLQPYAVHWIRRWRVLYLETSPFLYLYAFPSLISSRHCGLDDHSLVPWRVLIPWVPRAYRSLQFFKQSCPDWSGLVLAYSWDVLPLGSVLFYGSPSSILHPPQIYIFPKNIQRKLFSKILNMLVFYLLIRGNYILFYCKLIMHLQIINLSNWYLNLKELYQCTSYILNWMLNETKIWCND